MPTQKPPFLQPSPDTPAPASEAPNPHPDPTPLPTPQAHHFQNVFDMDNPFCIYRLDDQGRIEQVNMLTGDKLVLSSTVRDMAHRDLSKRVVPYRTLSGEIIFASRGMSLDDLYKACGRKKQAFSWLLAEQIAERVREGESITSICSQEGMPSYGVLCRWRKEEPDFALMLREARRDRAELLFDKSLSVLDEADERKNSIDLARLKSDVYAKAARVLNTEFSETQKIDATVGVRVLRADTGIRRPGDEGYDGQLFQDVSLQLSAESGDAGAELEVESLDE